MRRSDRISSALPAGFSTQPLPAPAEDPLPRYGACPTFLFLAQFKSEITEKTVLKLNSYWTPIFLEELWLAFLADGAREKQLSGGSQTEAEDAQTRKGRTSIGQMLRQGLAERGRMAQYADRFFSV